MRLIDVDDVHKLISQLKHYIWKNPIECNSPEPKFKETVGVDDLHFEIDKLPTVDAVPVVRCKNCVHRHWEQEPEHGRTVHYCDIFEEQIADNFFCADGRRKDNG